MGSGFSNPLVGGGGALVYPSIHSPNFSEATQTGWSIDKNGNAYFYGIVFAGEFAGTYFEINSAGAFFYQPGTTSPQFGTDDATTPAAMATTLGFAAVPACYRGYNTPATNGGTGVPASWPGPDCSPAPGAATVPVISIKPGGNGSNGDLAAQAVISGTYDAALAAYFASITIPDGGEVFVTCWAEGERDGATTAHLIGMHAHVLPIFTANAPAGAHYCQIFTTYTAYAGSAYYPLSKWVSCTANGGPDLYAYFFDAYPNTDTDASPSTSVSAALTQLRSVYPGATIGVTETNPNSGTGTTWTGGTSEQWFAGMWAWALAEDCLLFMPFYNNAVGIDWPPDSGTQTELTAIWNASGTSGPVLEFSIAAVAGTDQYGNDYDAGATTYTAGGGPLIQLLGGILNFGDTTSIDPLTYGGRLSLIPIQAHDDNPIVALDSPAADTAESHASLWLVGAPADGTTLLQAALFGLTAALAAVPLEFIVCGEITYGTTVGGLPVAEIWHTLTPGNSWANSGDGPDLQYRLLASPPSTVEIIGDLTPGTITNGTVIATLPAGYIPATTQAIGIVTPNGTPTTPGAMRLSVSSGTGTLICEQLSGLTNADRVAFHAYISLDA